MDKIKSKKKTEGNKGFTIIELMIATAIFAVIMLITTTAILGISKTYIQGLVDSQNQNTTRRIVSEISQDIQYNSPGTINIQNIHNINYKNPNGWFCIGQDVYIVNLDHEITNSSGDYGLIRYSSSSCPKSQPEITSGLPLSGTYNKGSVEELLTTDQQLSQFAIDENNGYYTITATVAYGNDFMPNPVLTSDGLKYQCNTSSYSLNFCSISSLTNSIEPSINN